MTALAPKDLAEVVGAKEVNEGLTRSFNTASALVRAYMERWGINEAEIPEEIVEQAILTVGAELYNQRKAPNGIKQFTDGSGMAVRVARDPMTGAYPLLDPYKNAWGFA